MKHREHIIAVFADRFNEVEKKHPESDGIFCSKLFMDREYNFIFPSDIIFAERKLLETNKNFRQIIPYIAIKDKKGNFLTYTRTKSGNESRLHKKVSIGFGGHIDATDAVFDSNSIISVKDTLKKATLREIKEELGEKAYNIALPLINNFNVSHLIIKSKGSNVSAAEDVESVHIGLLITLEVDDDFPVYSPENQINMEGFLSKDEIYALEGEVEDWSHIILSK